MRILNFKCWKLSIFVLLIHLKAKKTRFVTKKLAPIQLFITQKKIKVLYISTLVWKNVLGFKYKITFFFLNYNKWPLTAILGKSIFDINFAGKKALQQKGFHTLQKLWLAIIRKEYVQCKNIAYKKSQFNRLCVTKKYKWLKFSRNSYLGACPMIQTCISTIQFINLLFYLYSYQNEFIHLLSIWWNS